MTINKKLIILIIIIVIAPIILLLMFLFSYKTSSFLSDCVNLPKGIDQIFARSLMQKYISNPDYETFDNNWSLNNYDKSLSISTDRGFHLKTWRCLIYFKDDKLVDVSASF